MKKNFNKHIDQSFIPLSSSEFNYNGFTEALKKSKSKHFFNDTSKITEFEEALKIYLKTEKEIVCVSSGTAAIHLALLLAGVQKGDCVICQSFTYVASVNPILYVGAQPIFIDSNPETWNMDLDILEEVLEDLKKKAIHPKAIIAVNVYGMPSDMDRLIDLSEKYDIKLIEDSAESLGSKYKDISTGTLGDFGILSFNNNKILSTVGGGALICKDKEIKEKALFYANQARENNLDYTHLELGYNYRFSNIQAMLGLAQLSTIDENIIKRRQLNLFYRELFNGKKGVKIFKETSKKYFSNHWLTCILIDEEMTGLHKFDLQRVLNNNKIESRFLWKPMHLQPVFEKFEYYGNNTAQKLFKNGLCLPSGSNLTEEDKNRISTAIKTFLS